MFFHRRHHRPSLLKLILVFLGFNCLTRRCREERSEEERKEFRSKARQFRSKLKEAFGVWEEEDAPATEPSAESEAQ